MSETSLKEARWVEQELASALSLVGWYRRCLEDVEAGKIVRGLNEARAGYEKARLRVADLDPKGVVT